MSSRKLLNAASTKKCRQLIIAGLIASNVALCNGCGIPKLRNAQAGPELPQTYNWNNGSSYWPLKQENSQGSRESSQTSTHHASDSPVRLTSFTSVDASPSLSSGEPSAVNSGTRSEAGIIELVQEDGLIVQVEQNGQTESQRNSQPATGLLPVTAFYQDAYLTDLINQALVGNQELKILAEEIRIASNEAYSRSGDYRPFVTAGVGAGVEKSGLHTRNGAVESQLNVADGREFPDPLGNFMAVTNVSWELDIWKRLRNSQRAAAIRYLASQDGRNFVVTRLVAEVAENYYELLALDSRLDNLLATIEIQEKSLKVAQARKEAGKGTELAVQRFQAEVQKNYSECSVLQQEIVEVENRINYLVGRYPQSVSRMDAEFVDINMQVLGAGVPSELLLQRADIQEAEKLIEAAGLDVQVARARFYPSLSLTGGLGWNAFSTGFLFRTPESLVYGVAGELVGPLINKRAIQAAYCSANAAQLQAIYNYQQIVLEAHIQVVNQITKVENFRRSIEVKKQQIASLEASVEVAIKLFQNSQAEYVEVLLAQREMMEARRELIDTKQEQLVAIVNTYQALGGGGF